jgi:RNA polymerase sigma-70 factor (sigma-E family)
VGAVRTEVFEAVWRAERDRLVALAVLISGDRDVAEDAVAEAVARTLTRWRSKGVEDLRLYLRRAVINEIVGRWRRRSVEQRSRSVTARDPLVSASDRVIEREVLWAALRRLPAGQRAALVLRFYDDLSERQTAVVLGVSVGTVKSRVSRALTRLRELLADSEEDVHVRP